MNIYIFLFGLMGALVAGVYLETVLGFSPIHDLLLFMLPIFVWVLFAESIKILEKKLRRKREKE